mmetsp:Transcript_10900/g.20377  ORF Transcript_10900/g.20377 Transcript_10900/m.20377 type:complete len:832 (+) Transcript_10900:1-2496(+)
MDKINANRKRNQERLVALGFFVASQSSSTSKPPKDNSNRNSNTTIIQQRQQPRERKRGMLFHTEYNHDMFKDRHHSTTLSCDFQSTSLHEQYPHRKREITLLSSLLRNAVRQLEIPFEMDGCGNILNSFCPPPILVHGPSGTGKTSIVCQILKRVQKESSMDMKNIRTAYVNCRTIERYGSGASPVLQSLYRQLEQDFGGIYDCDVGGDVGGSAIVDDGDEVGKDEQVHDSFMQENTMSLDLNTDDDSVFFTNSSMHSRTNRDDDSVIFTTSSMHSRTNRDDDNSNDNDFVVEGDEDSFHNVFQLHEEDVIEHYAARERRGLVQKDDDTVAKKTSIPKYHAEGKMTRRSTRRMTDNNHLDTSSKSNMGNIGKNLSNNVTAGMMDSTNVSGSTVVSFGRSIAKFCGISKYSSFPRGCAFVVLDHAEELLSFSHNRQKGSIHTNFLSEMLLLPKTMKLNLTIIAITDKLMLEQSRISNIDEPSNTLGTIQSAICPVICHFQGYQNEEMLRDVINTTHLMEFVIGKCTGTSTYTSDPSIRRLYKSLVDIVIHSVESTTRDVGEILRLTRILWPLYLTPLKKRNAQNNTIKSLATSVDSPIVVNRELLEKLGEHVRPHLRQLITKCLFRPFRTLAPSHASAATHADTSSVSLPYFTKFLLLAAYLCQTNRADTDRILYTNYRAGQKRRRKTEAYSNSNNNDGPANNTSSQNSFLDRVPSFPFERMLSVFSSICNKYASKDVCDTVSTDGDTMTKLRKDSVDTAHLGNLSLMRCLSELRHCGLLEESAASGMDWSDEKLAYSKSMSSTKFICRLSKEEAKEIARSLDFPLEAYLIQ